MASDIRQLIDNLIVSVEKLGGEKLGDDLVMKSSMTNVPNEEIEVNTVLDKVLDNVVKNVEQDEANQKEEVRKEKTGQFNIPEIVNEDITSDDEEEVDLVGGALCVFYTESPFSDFTWSPFFVDGRHYCSVEHFFQIQMLNSFGMFRLATKLIDIEDSNTFRKSLRNNLKTMIKSGLFDERMFAKWRRENAGKMMKKGNKAKFQQNFNLKEQLLMTGDRLLVFTNKNDWLLGVGMTELQFLSWIRKNHVTIDHLLDIFSGSKPRPKGLGANHLGIALMEVRAEMWNRLSILTEWKLHRNVEQRHIDPEGSQNDCGGAEDDEATKKNENNDKNNSSDKNNNKLTKSTKRKIKQNLAAEKEQKKLDDELNELKAALKDSTETVMSHQYQQQEATTSATSSDNDRAETTQTSTSGVSLMPSTASASAPQNLTQLAVGQTIRTETSATDTLTGAQRLHLPGTSSAFTAAGVMASKEYRLLSAELNTVDSAAMEERTENQLCSGFESLPKDTERYSGGLLPPSSSDFVGAGLASASAGMAVEKTFIRHAQAFISPQPSSSASASAADEHSQKIADGAMIQALPTASVIANRQTAEANNASAGEREVVVIPGQKRILYKRLDKAEEERKEQNKLIEAERKQKQKKFDEQLRRNQMFSELKKQTSGMDRGRNTAVENLSVIQRLHALSFEKPLVNPFSDGEYKPLVVRPETNTGQQIEKLQYDPVEKQKEKVLYDLCQADMYDGHNMSSAVAAAAAAAPPTTTTIMYASKSINEKDGTLNFNVVDGVETAVVVDENVVSKEESNVVVVVVDNVIVPVEKEDNAAMVMVAANVVPNEQGNNDNNAADEE